MTFLVVDGRFALSDRAPRQARPRYGSISITTGVPTSNHVRWSARIRAGVGLVPEVGTSWFLTRRVGYQSSFELFLSGRQVSGREAAELGIANECVPHEQLPPRALEWCDRVAAVPAHAVAMAKPLLRSAADMSWDQALVMEEFAEPMSFTTDAHREAVREFLAGRTR